MQIAAANAIGQNHIESMPRPIIAATTHPTIVIIISRIAPITNFRTGETALESTPIRNRTRISLVKSQDFSHLSYGGLEPRKAHGEFDVASLLRRRIVVERLVQLVDTVAMLGDKESNQPNRSHSHSYS
jgi:hypothetical protein